GGNQRTGAREHVSVHDQRGVYRATGFEGCGVGDGVRMTKRNSQTISVLLVDDDPDCRLLLRDALSECDVATEIFEVASGEKALEFLACGSRYVNMPCPALIYLDVEMPGGIDGLETLRRIRAKREFREIPVVIL